MFALGLFSRISALFHQVVGILQSFFPVNLAVQRIHMIGIGGSGMSGIAEVLHTLGYQVSGSDIADNRTVQHLRTLGMAIQVGHQVQLCQDADVIVISSAIDQTNPEVQFALAQQVPIIPRAQMLAELMRFRYGIAVAGTHGKTTTTSLIAHIFATANLDPTYVIGGRLKRAESNAVLGEGEYFIAEADESDGSFLHLQPMIGVVTNIDADHLPNFENSFEKLQQSFLAFFHQLPFYGLAILCQDDPNLLAIKAYIARRTVTYGFAEQSQVRASDYQQCGLSSRFLLHVGGQTYPIQLALAGQYNVQNALAAIAVALQCDIGIEAITAALASFPGIGRRTELIGEIAIEGGKATLLDDYGHHPKEISVTWEAIRAAYPDRRILWIYQPHRYSRTQALFDDLVQALSKPDVLCLLKEHAASETFLAGADSRALCASIRQRGKQPIYIEEIDQVSAVLKPILCPGDVIVTQGAGGVGQLPKILLHELAV